MVEVVTVDVLGSPMEVFVFPAEGQGPHPGLILAQHIPVGHTGLENDEFTLKTAERYAQNGFTVAVPFIFHWWPKTDDILVKRDGSRDDWMVADLKGAWDVLSSRDDVTSKIGVAGHCWGGRVAWLGACHLDVSACAIFYGGRIKLAMGANQVPAIELAGNIHCPVAGFFGSEDRNPTPADVDDYSTALTAASVPHEFHRYDGAGHAFQNFPTPERYHKEASEDAWDKALTFFNHHLTIT